MGFLKKIGKFLKKNTRDIATVIGFALGGPAGAALGQGLGSLAEGRDFKKSVGSSLKVFGGTTALAGAGITGGNPAGSLFGNTGRIQIGAPMGAEQLSGGIKGVFQGLGSDARNLISGSVPENLLSKGAFENLNMFEKAALASGVGALGGMDQQNLPNFDTSMFTSNLGAGGPGPINPYTGMQYDTGSFGNVDPVLVQNAAAGDPLSQIILDELRKKQIQMAALPQFDTVALSKDGGEIKRLADGGALPEVDLREHGGETSDPDGSGDVDTIPALLADGEFVMTKQAVKGIGDGNHSKGISTLYAMMNKNEEKAQNMGLGRA
tara:strand:+ start:277 stop:1242 length:966 start_codon:yes stop_codon:yes gene_type:complete